MPGKTEEVCSGSALCRALENGRRVSRGILVFFKDDGPSVRSIWQSAFPQNPETKTKLLLCAFEFLLVYRMHACPPSVTLLLLGFGQQTGNGAASHRAVGSKELLSVGGIAKIFFVA